MDSNTSRTLPLFSGPNSSSTSMPAPGLIEGYRWEHLGANRSLGPATSRPYHPEGNPLGSMTPSFPQQPYPEARVGDRYPPYCNVYVAGLPLTLNEDGLLEIGQKFGQVIELKLLTEVAARKHHRTLSGFLRYSKRSESDKCISCESYLPLFSLFLLVLTPPTFLIFERTNRTKHSSNTLVSYFLLHSCLFLYSSSWMQDFTSWWVFCFTCNLCCRPRSP